MEKIELPQNDTTSKAITFKIGEKLPNLIMTLNQLSIGYQDETLVSINQKLEITKDMRIGIIGKNGIGKTTLLKTILGELPSLYGGVEIHPNMRIGSYSQIANELDRDSTIIKEIIGPGISQKEARTLLGSLLISQEKMDQKIATLSGGEKAKVALTKMLLSKPHIIIMDEPTNHLDIGSKEVIKSMLKEFDGVSIIVSHDRDFLEGTSNLLWLLKEKELTVFHNLQKGFKTLEESC